MLRRLKREQLVNQGDQWAVGKWSQAADDSEVARVGKQSEIGQRYRDWLRGKRDGETVARK